MVLTGFLATGQVPSTTTATTRTTVATTSTTDPAGGAALDHATGSLLCSAEIGHKLLCVVVSPITTNTALQYEWTIDGAAAPEETRAALLGTHIITVGTHHVVAVAVLGSHRTPPFTDDVTVRPPPPIPAPPSVKVPIYYWFVLGTSTLTIGTWIVRKVRAS